MVQVDTDRWYCHRCNSGGDVFELYVQYHGVRFREALEALSSDGDVLSSSGQGAPRVPRVSQNRVLRVVERNWEVLNDWIQKRRDARIAQSRAMEDVLGYEEAFWDGVEADAVADRQWAMLDAATTEQLYLLSRRR